MSKFIKVTYQTYYSRYLSPYEPGKPEAIDIIFLVEVLANNDHEASFNSDVLKQLFDSEIDSKWFHKTLIKVGDREITHAPLPVLPYYDVPFKPTLLNLAENIYNIMDIFISETFSNIKLISIEVSTYTDSAIYKKS